MDHVSCYSCKLVFIISKIFMKGGTAMAKVTEIAPDVYRISIYVPEFNLQFNHFLIKDDEPLLFHTGYKRMFPQVHDAVATIIKPSEIRWISFSHFESDECGSLNQWLEIAPAAQCASTFIGALVNLNDFAIRPPRAMADGEVLTTGKYRFRFCSTAHVPPGWDAGVLFEETQRTLLCSDLFHHVGDVEPAGAMLVVNRERFLGVAPECRRAARQRREAAPRFGGLVNAAAPPPDPGQPPQAVG
jgi:flavorubredoxin